MLNKKGFTLIFLICCTLSVWGQKIGIKNNLLYDATLTPNLGVEMSVGKKSTLDLSAGLNPFTFNDGKKFKHWLVQPEYRRWFCEKFNGTFWGGSFAWRRIQCSQPEATFRHVPITQRPSV